MSLYTDENKVVIGELWHEHEEDDLTIDCALCGAEVDEETTVYGICEKCWTEHHNFDNALAYGAKATESVRINGLYANMLTPERIDVALKKLVMENRKNHPRIAERMADEFLRDDDGDFADWLKEQKNID